MSDCAIYTNLNCAFFPFPVRTPLRNMAGGSGQDSGDPEGAPNLHPQERADRARHLPPHPPL